MVRENPQRRRPRPLVAAARIGDRGDVPKGALPSSPSAVRAGGSGHSGDGDRDCLRFTSYTLTEGAAFGVGQRLIESTASLEPHC